MVCKDVDFLATRKYYLARVLTSCGLAWGSNSEKARATPTASNKRKQEELFIGLTQEKSRLTT